MDTYENKYKEAKRLYKAANADQRYVLESLFPELAESEDERIRKTLVEFFTDWGKSRSHCWSVSIPKILAWLEKQGEQKSAWSVEDETHINSIIAYLLDYKLLVYEEDMNVANGVQKELDWLKSLKQRIGG